MFVQVITLTNIFLKGGQIPECNQADGTIKEFITDGSADQNLVPKSTNEMEETDDCSIQTSAPTGRSFSRILANSSARGCGTCCTRSSTSAAVHLTIVDAGLGVSFTSTQSTIEWIDPLF